MKNLDYLKNLEDKYKKQLKLDPESNSFVLLAEILIKRKKIDEAVGFLVKGLKHNKHNITARFLLGKIYYERWMIDSAKKEFEKIIKIAPDNLAVAKILIEIYKAEGEFGKAEDILKNLSFYYPNSEELKKLDSEFKTNDRIDYLNLKHDNKIQNHTGEKFKVLNDKDIVSETLLELYFEQCQYKESLEIYKKLLLISPRNKSLMDKIAKIEQYYLNEKSA